MTASRVRATVTLVIATGAYATALVLRHQVDPWRATALAAAISIALSVWALGRKALALFAIDLRGVVGALALGVALVVATHVGVRLVETASPALAGTIDALYASVDVGASRLTLVALTLLVVLGEELVWRGVAVELARTRSSIATGALSVALYMLPQLAAAVVLLIVAAAVLGTVFAAQRLRTGRLLEPLITHAVWSIAIFVVMPLPSA